MESYLDNAASTMLDRRVRSAMLDAYAVVGNADSTHRNGSFAREIVEESRERIGSILHAEKIVFTSGATEANNLALNGQKVMTTAIEHSSVLEPCKRERGRVLPVDRQGVIPLSTLHHLPSQSLVSVGHVNNEVGTIAPLKNISKIVREMGGVFHSDAVQSAPAMLSSSGDVLSMKTLGLNALSLSAHKIHGPQGIGCLALREWSSKPLMLGGGQQYGLRSGTLPVALIVGFATAMDVLKRSSLNGAPERSRWFEKKLWSLGAISTVKKHSWNIVSVRFPNIESALLLGHLDARGISASAGSACHAHEDRSSHVLKALGLSDKESRETVRFSLSRYTTRKELTYAVDVIEDVVGELKG